MVQISIGKEREDQEEQEVKVKNMNKIAYTHLENFPNDFIPEVPINIKKNYISCPECKKILSFLDYCCDGYEHGTYNPNREEDYQANGFELNGDTTYACPECGLDIAGWEDCHSLTKQEKEVLCARFEEFNHKRWNIKNFKKEIITETSKEEEEIIKKEKLTKITNLKVCKYCKKIIPTLEQSGEKSFCPHCMKEYHEKENTRPIF
jgi:hypothetical protein